MLWRALQGLRASRSNKREEIEAHQARQLRGVVHHAARRVPYYRRLFKREGLRPEDIRTPADLKRLPILTRSDVQENQDGDLLSEDFDRGTLVAHVTNATTGYPLTIRRTRFEERFLQGLRLLHAFRLGMRPLDRRVIVRCPDPLSRSDGIEQTWWTRIGLLRTEIANCLMSPDAILARIRHLRPNVLGGYPGSLAWVAGHVTEEDRLLIRPRFVTTGGETLTENMRRQIAEGFGAPVYDFYGANELNLIAAECPRGGGCYHRSGASVIAEGLRDGQPVEPGESGELVATGLFSQAMPLIRYRLGDEVTLGETGCQCGA
ncbi:MAG: phenylacetate--CoA ligase family protein, partial [bacterium]|nr:phenylacetate--CoA ligase family protein [bacterium]